MQSCREAWQGENDGRKCGRQHLTEMLGEQILPRVVADTSNAEAARGQLREETVLRDVSGREGISWCRGEGQGKGRGVMAVLIADARWL